LWNADHATDAESTQLASFHQLPDGFAGAAPAFAELVGSEWLGLNVRHLFSPVSV